MKTPRLIIALLFVMTGGFLVAQTNFSVEKVDMTISGTSTLHDWTSTANDVKVKGNIDMSNGSLTGIDNFTVSIPVKSIKSEKGGTMDNKTHQALKSDKHPTITYQLEKVNSIDKSNNGYKIRTQGKLTMAGSTKMIYMTVEAKKISNGAICFEGSYSLNMTDYGISPPTAMLGTIKTGEEVTINYKLTVSVNDMSK